MARNFGFRAARVFVPACAVVAGLVMLARPVRAEAKPHLAGQWTFNRDQSDDAGQKVREAEASAKGRQRSGSPDRGGYPTGSDVPGGGYPGGSGRVGYPGGGYPGGMGLPGGMGRVGVGGVGRGGRRSERTGEGAGLSPEDLEPLAANPKTLSVKQDDKLVEIIDDNGQTRNLYPDGKKHKETDASGRGVSIKSRWDGDRLVAESKLAHAGKLTETYELSPDGKQLVVISQLDNSQLSAPLVIRRVYDRSGAK